MRWLDSTKARIGNRWRAIRSRFGEKLPRWPAGRWFVSGSVLFGLVVFSYQLIAADEQPYTAFLKGTGATAVLMILLGLDSAFGRAARCRAASGMAIKRDGRSGGRSGRAAGGDPYAKLAQDNRLSHKSVERSLDRASRIAKQASRQAKNSKG